MKISQHFEWRTHINKDLTSCDVSCGIQGHLTSLRRHLSDPAGSGCVHLILQLQDSLYQWAKGKSREIWWYGHKNRSLYKIRFWKSNKKVQFLAE